MRQPLFLIRCVAVFASVALLSTATYAQHKTAKACETEWRANKAAIQGAGKKKKDFITECRAGTGQTAAVPAPAPSTATTPPAQSTTPTTPPASDTAKTEGSPTPRRRFGTATPSGAARYASETEARSHCPGDTVVWANTRSKIYHFAGTRTYGKTKSGAYMCEKDTAAAGIRSAKNEKRPQ
jgi:uncharacterized membrane protein